MEELLSMREGGSSIDVRLNGANDTEKEEEAEVSSPSRGGPHGKINSMQVQLRSKALLISSTAACIAHMLVLWACWAVWRVRQVLVEATSSSSRERDSYPVSDLAGYECSTAESEWAEEGSGGLYQEQNDSVLLSLESTVGPWRSTLPESRQALAPAPPMGSQHDENIIFSDFGTLTGLPQVVSPRQQSWGHDTSDTRNNASSTGSSIGAALCSVASESSPQPLARNCAHLEGGSCGSSSGSTAPTSPETDRGKTMIFAVDGGKCCSLCGYTLEEGEEVVTSPACGEGIMVSGRCQGWG